MEIRETCYLYVGGETQMYIYLLLSESNFFKNKNISKKLKLILKHKIIDKKLTYALEISSLTKRDRSSTFLRGKCVEEF